MLVFLSHHFDSAGSSAGSWDIDACPADGCSTPKICITASREHKGVTTGRDTQDASEVYYAVWQFFAHVFALALTLAALILLACQHSSTCQVRQDAAPSICTKM